MAVLKLAKKEDAGKVADFFSDLFANSIYAKSMEYRPEDVSDVVSSLAEKPDQGVTLLLTEGNTIVGAMICSSITQIFNRSEKTAVEVGFWILPEHRSLSTIKQILRAYRYWAKQTGCTSIMHGKLKDDSSVESYTIRKLV